ALRAWAGAVHDSRGERAVRPRGRVPAAAARARGEARPRRAASRGDGARVVRPGRAAPPAPRLARGAAQGGRARGAGRARTFSAELARHRPARDVARGARAVAGFVAAGLVVGVGFAASACTGRQSWTARPTVL